MKIALVHDYLKEFGGAERVLEALHQMWPEAPVYTSFVDWEALGPHAERIKKWTIVPSWANNWWMKKWHSPLRFLAPYVWESFDFRGFDVVITSSAWFIPRGIITQPETMHISYVHTPPRHLYGYSTALEWQKYWLVRVYAAIVNQSLRMYDYLAAQRVDYYIANSIETKRRIAKFYRREAEVIYPPVKAQSAKLKAQSQNSKLKTEQYFLCVSRLARAKHIDLAIEACQELGLPLKIVGKGRDENYLRSKVEAGRSKVEFLGEISDEELDKIYDGAKALIFPAEDEEFGIVAVEAMGHGVPVIAYRSGGLPETIVDGKTGVFFDELTVESVMKAIKHFNNIYQLSISAKNCQLQAQKFSESRFKKEMVEFVEKKWEEYKRAK